jgi:hypothetical protein
MTWDPKTLIEAAKRAGIQYAVDPGWLVRNPFGTNWASGRPAAPVGVVWHHTATKTLAPGDAPSLWWCVNLPEYPESRAAGILVGRSGKFYIIGGNAQYHAGAGGPMTVGGTDIPKDNGNRYLLGIEIEAASTDRVGGGETPKDSMTQAQFDAVSKFCAALCDIMGWPTSANIRHRDWAPGRKTDVGLPLETIRTEVEKYRAKPQSPTWDKRVPSRAKALEAANDRSIRNAAAWRLACRLHDKGIREEKPDARGEQAYPRSAMRRFQLQKGLTGALAKGLPNPETWMLLFGVDKP